MLDRLGIGALRNTSCTPFLTSDNPVVYFDPDIPQEKMMPYNIRREGGSVVLLFPITPDIVIYGHSQMREGFTYNGFFYSEISDVEAVENINRQICRFAYKAVFARDPGYETIVREHSDLSPVIQFQRLQTETGEMLIAESVFGTREPKPKWTQ